ncbi:MAG TPA: type 4a pilus biogenesis protein PilO [Vicinamibacterales bacterium]|jgi:type IV pilus assembly protein PilO
MDISLSKLPWYAQIGAFVVMAVLSVYGFYTYYVTEVSAEIAMKHSRLTNLRADINKGVATARRLGEFQSQVTDLERRLDALKNVLPEQKDVADTLRRIQALATQSNLTLLRFTPAPTKQQPLYLEVPYQLIADGSFHNLALFFDRVAKFQRIINVGDISISAKPVQASNSTITATLTATTFVLQESAGRGGRGGPPPAR